MNHDEINLVLITPHGRSGSLFIQSLLDGHPQVITIPDLSLTYKFEFEKLEIDQIADYFIARHPAIFNSALGYLGKVQTHVTKLFGEKGESHLVKDTSRFRFLLIGELKVIKNNLKEVITRKLFWIAVHKAYAKLLNRNVNDIKYIVFHEHGYSEAHRLAIQDFPNLYYIAMVRDPREDWFSWQKVLLAREGKRLGLTRKYHMHQCISEYSNSVTELVHFAQIISPRNLIVIDLNRFHSLNNQGMRALAEKLSIKFELSLLQSTFDGQVWFGNSADRRPISGFDVTKTQFGWYSGLSDSEIKRIELALTKEMHVLNYETRFTVIQGDFSYPYISAFFSFIFTALSNSRSTRKYVACLPIQILYALRVAKCLFSFPKKVILDLSLLKFRKSARNLSGLVISKLSFL